METGEKVIIKTGEKEEGALWVSGRKGDGGGGGDLVTLAGAPGDSEQRGRERVSKYKLGRGPVVLVFNKPR